MNSRYIPQSIAGLDIGSNKIRVVIARTDGNGQPEVLGASSVPSRGIKKGVVINMEQAAAATITAIEQAELQAGITIDSVLLGISGGYIETVKNQGTIAIDGEITQQDIMRVLEASTNFTFANDREIIHVLPEEFSVDNQHGIKNPVGMIGTRLEARVHIITVASASVSNLINSVYKAGFNTSDIFLKSLASAHALLKEDEKDTGCVLIDIGADATDYVVFLDGGLKHTGQIAVGGAHITNDLSYGLKTTTHIAEQIKCEYGCAIADAVPLQEQIELPNPSGRSERIESRKLIAEIIQPRMEEILFLVNEEIEKTGLKSHLSSGVILTGGVACTDYIEELAAEIFRLPIRLGYPRQLRGLDEFVRNPAFSVATGLALYGLNHAPKGTMMSSNNNDRNFQNIVHRIQDWFNEFF